MTKKGFKCPHCGVAHKEYALRGGARTPMCMKCHKLVPKDLVPKEYIQYRPAEKRGKGIAVKREEGKKAREIGYNIVYPLEERRYEKYEPPHKVRKKAYYAENPEERYAPSYREHYRARRDRDESTLDRMEHIIDKLIKLMSMARKR